MPYKYIRILVLLLLFNSIFSYSGTAEASGSAAAFQDGAFVYFTTQKKATSNIRYQTIGWYIHLKKTCTTNDYKGKCDPTTLKTDEYFRLQDSGNGHMISDVPDQSDTNMITTFRWTADEVKAAIGKAKAEQAIYEGMPLYASAIMRVVTGPREKPSQVSGPYHTLQGIVNAQDWAEPKGLIDYFDVELTFHGEKYPVNMILKLSNGTVVDQKVIGTYLAGHEITKSFPEKINYGNKEYEIYQSWLSPVIRPGDQFYIQKKDAGDQKVVQRNFNVFVGGVNMVAAYRNKSDTTLPSGDGDCTYTIGPPNQIAAPNTAFMDPQATGVILGDDSANGRHFDAVRAIPTSENLYANTWGMNYLFDHTFGNMAGQVHYVCKVKVTYPTKWEEKQPDKTGPDGKPVPQPSIPKTGKLTKMYEFELTPREYEYWKINQLEVYQIDQAKMENYALPNEEVWLYPNGYDPPEIDWIIMKM